MVSKQNLNYLFQLFPAGTIIETDSFQQNILFWQNKNFWTTYYFLKILSGRHQIYLWYWPWSELWLKENGVKSTVLLASVTGRLLECRLGISTPLWDSVPWDPWGNPPWLNSCRPYWFSHWKILVHQIQHGISTILSLVDWSVICNPWDAIRNAEIFKALQIGHPWAIKGQSSATNQFSIFPLY